MNSTISELSTELRDQRRQKSARRVAQSARPVVAHAHHAAKLMRATNEAISTLRLLLQVNFELALSDAKRVAGYVLIWLGVAAAFFLDYVVIGVVGEYFAHLVAYTPGMVTLARIVIPASILTIEMLIATQRSFAYEEALEYGHSRSHRVWVFLGLTLLCASAALVVATHLASLPARLTPALEGILRYQLIGLVALCVVVHALVLFGGRMAMEAKGYLWFKVRELRLNRKAGRLHDNFDAAATAATNGYIEHVRLVREHNMQFLEAQLRPGPFDKLTRQLLQARLDDEDEDLVPLPPAAPRVTHQDGSRPVTEIPAREQSNLI